MELIAWNQSRLHLRCRVASSGIHDKCNTRWTRITLVFSANLDDWMIWLPRFAKHSPISQWSPRNLYCFYLPTTLANNRWNLKQFNEMCSPLKEFSVRLTWKKNASTVKVSEFCITGRMLRSCCLENTTCNSIAKLRTCQNKYLDCELNLTRKIYLWPSIKSSLPAVSLSPQWKCSCANS